MSSISDEIKDIVLRALPKLSEDILRQVVTTLEGSGVESIQDLKYVHQDDIKDLLPVIQQRKLLQAFKLGNYCQSSVSSFPVQLKLHNSPPSSSSEPQSPCISSKVHQNTNISKWYETFQVPWDKMPEEVQSAIANSKRPAPDKRRQMIRVLVDEIRKHDTNPTRSECLIICRNIVKQYPSSFADMTPGGVIIGGGFASLLSQVKTRIENIHRAGTFKRHHSSRLSGQQQKIDSYGCTQFQPEPPPGETDETLEQKRQQLQNIYKQEGLNSIEKAQVLNLMKTTFCLQRNHINQTPAPSTEDMRIQWPYLFTQRGIYSHFESLTGINVLHPLELSIEETLFNVCMQCSYKHKVIPNSNSFVQMSSTAADMEHTLTLPASPRLILQVAGDEVTIGSWRISTESRVVCEGLQPTFITGLAAVFATYYVFNLQYQEEAARTLEFVQRRFLGIKPERGTKASQGKVVSKKTGKLVQKKAAPVNPHVATLIKNLLDFEWGFM
uniref:Si:ch211-111e20.1 n=1 Tax=Sphaeramia orbicularis TaxID=375764 RepID=A0A673AGA4_9TELE